MDNVIKKLDELYSQLDFLTEKVRKELYKKCDEIHFENSVQNGSCAIVNFSDIKNNNNIFSPEYYIDEVQISTLKNVFNKCCDTKQMLMKTKNMLEKKYIRVNNNKVYLNKYSLAVLENIFDTLKPLMTN